MMPFDNTRLSSNRDATAAYHGVSATEQKTEDYDYDVSASTLADSVSLPTTAHDEQWQNGLNEKAPPNHPHPETVQGTRRSTVYFSALILTSILPLCGMIAWINTVTVRPGDSIFTGFNSSAEIGGHLTQTQAKAVDFSCSALLAPLLMAGLNFIWFACARVCVVNEHSATHLSSHGVPLQSLTRASRTSAGTYNLVGLWELFSAKTWRLSLLGSLALLSAISSSALSNIIAYKSCDEVVPSTENYTLRMLSDNYIFRDEHSNDILDTGAELFYHDPAQIKLAAHNMSTMLDGLYLQNAALDSEGGYIGPNATDISLNSVAGNVKSLHKVPGYRVTADCIPTTLEKDSITVSYEEMGHVLFKMSAELPSALAAKYNATYNATRTGLHYQWTGNPMDYSFDEDPQFNFIAFPSDAREFVYLVHLDGGNRSDESVSERTIPTAWGGLSPIYQNFTIPNPKFQYITIPEDPDGFSGDHKYVTNSYALQCILLRQEVLLEYARRDDQTWFIAGTSFKGDPKPVPSFFGDFQTKLSLERPAPALGDVLWGGATGMEMCNQQLNLDRDCIQYKNFSTAVENFVYASGEAFRILYNVGALNASGDEHEYFYNVTGEWNMTFYRITYVPVLLMVALLGIIICSLLVTFLVITTMKTWSWKIFRQVDITRLVVDCVGADLAKNGPDFTRLGRASDDELEKWAGKYRVGYEKVIDAQNDDGDEPWVRLRHIAGGDVQKPGTYETVRSA